MSLWSWGRRSSVSMVDLLWPGTAARAMRHGWRVCRLHAAESSDREISVDIECLDCAADHHRVVLPINFEEDQYPRFEEASHQDCPVRTRREARAYWGVLAELFW